MSGQQYPEPKIEIQNVVASVTLNQKLDLQAIQNAFPQVDYKPAQFPAWSSGSRSRGRPR